MAGTSLGPRSEDEAAAQAGRVLQVNVSPGGVPKLPIPEAYVDKLGLAGDRHRDDTEHGGPHRAVTLFAVEAIRRVAAEGHPIAPGTAGENLTVEGIELAALPVGARLAVGESLVLEISKPDNPCKTIAGSFSDGRFSRISILANPLDSRMYARVIRPGTVRPGDAISVLPAAPDSEAVLHELLDRLDAVERSEALLLWRGAAQAGHDVRILDDGELAIAAAPEMPQPIFSSALGLRQLPNLLGRMLDFYRGHDAVGWLVAGADDPPWPAAPAGGSRSILVATPDEVADAPGARAADAVPGLRVRALDAADADRWAALMLADWDVPPNVARAFVDGTRARARAHDHHLFGAELAGQLVGVERLHLRRGVALMGGGAVLRGPRRGDIHRALIAACAVLAADRDCAWLAAHAPPDSPSERHLQAMGLRRAWRRSDYRFDPSAPEMPPVSEAGLAMEQMA